MSRNATGATGKDYSGIGPCFSELADYVYDDINQVLDAYEAGIATIPDVDMVVGGFPCQDYSVAKPLSQAGGIDGRKGVLWWEEAEIRSARERRPVVEEPGEAARPRLRDHALLPC